MTRDSREEAMRETGIVEKDACTTKRELETESTVVEQGATLTERAQGMHESPLPCCHRTASSPFACKRFPSRGRAPSASSRGPERFVRDVRNGRAVLPCEKTDRAHDREPERVRALWRDCRHSGRVGFGQNAVSRRRHGHVRAERPGGRTYMVRRRTAGHGGACALARQGRVACPPEHGPS